MKQTPRARTNLVEMSGKLAYHMHPDAEHTLLVVKGSVCAWAGTKAILLEEGDYIAIPAGVPHKYETITKKALLLSFDAPAYDPTKTVTVSEEGVAFDACPARCADYRSSGSTRIGYGSNVVGAGGGNDGFGLKRQLTTTIVGVATSFVHIGKSGQTACGGDSGGPALLSIGGVETIIGLDSYSDAKVDCSKGEYYQRVDAELPFISQFMALPPGGDTGESPPASRETPPAGSPSGGSTADEGHDATTPGVGAAAQTSAASACALGRASRGGTPAWPLAMAFGLALARWRRRSYARSAR